MTGWDDRVLDSVDPSQHALTRSTDQSHNLFIDLDEILSERPPAAVATQPVDAQNQIIHLLGDHHGSGHFLSRHHLGEFYFAEQGYLRTVGGE